MNTISILRLCALNEYYERRGLIIFMEACNDKAEFVKSYISCYNDKVEVNFCYEVSNVDEIDLFNALLNAQGYSLGVKFYQTNILGVIGVRITYSCDAELWAGRVHADKPQITAHLEAYHAQLAQQEAVSESEAVSDDDNDDILV